MPYIANEKRIAIDSGSSRISEWSEGDLNYAITSMLLKWVGMHPSYSDYNAAIGVLECAKLELYRRRIAQFEDSKCAANGDVY